MQTATVRWTGEQKFIAVSPSGHALAMDSDRNSNTGPGAMELLLMALGACTATDIVIILEKKRQKLVRVNAPQIPRKCGASSKFFSVSAANWKKVESSERSS